MVLLAAPRARAYHPPQAVVRGHPAALLDDVRRRSDPGAINPRMVALAGPNPVPPDGLM